jgi:hypothetical protein
MIESILDPEQSILYVRPKSALEKSDFVKLAEKVDPYIEAHGGLRGLIIEVTSFPGWESFAALIAHIRFVRDHHRRIERIAVVTDSPIGNLAERLASHFVSAQIRHFATAEVESAKAWINGPGESDAA